jgi:Protein of unknown function (DUF2865)
VRIRFAIIPVCLALVTLSGAPASAQGFFDWFRGGQQRQDSWSGQRQYVPPQANAYSDPYARAPEQYGTTSAAPSSGGTGRYVAYCVRLCDGRYFPMQRHGNATSIQLCNAFCPAAKTQVFNGSAIDQAVANSGARYADLDNAFVYREKIVSGCTCNGRDSFGLAKIDVANDPTMRQGDIVATGDNVKVALTAMAAARERATAREAVNERPVLRGTSRRAAAAAAPPAEEPPED